MKPTIIPLDSHDDYAIFPTLGEILGLKGIFPDGTPVLRKTKTYSSDLDLQNGIAISCEAEKNTSWYPSEKYDRQTGFIFPNFRGEHKKYVGNHDLEHEHENYAYKSCTKTSLMNSQIVSKTDSSMQKLVQSTSILNLQDFALWLFGVGL